MDRSPTAPFYEPFPPQTGGRPRGPDPVHTVAYRGAVTGADAYRATREAARRDRTALRVGNRFVRPDRYREIAFLAIGRAAVSQALAVTDSLGESVTQGLVVGPIDPPPELPFRHRRVASGWPGEGDATAVIEDASELAQGLGERDLLLVLLSPGALSSLARPPGGLNGAAWTEWLRALHAHGATGGEVALLARTTGEGLVGGRLAERTRADVETLVVERGDGGLSVGGGPTCAVTDEERARARTVLDRVGAGVTPPAPVPQVLRSAAERRHERAGVHRPVVVAGPADALRGAADAVGERTWMPRLAFVSRPSAPAPLADAFLARVDELLEENRAAVRAARRSGVVALGTTTFDLPEGVDERTALSSFLERARSGIPRRDTTVGAMRTFGASDGPAPGAVTSAALEKGSGTVRPIPMRAGITDVGCLLVGLVPITTEGA